MNIVTLYFCFRIFPGILLSFDKTGCMMGEADADDRSGGLTRSRPDCSRCVLYPTWDSSTGRSFDVAAAVAERYGARLVVVSVGSTGTDGTPSGRPLDTQDARDLVVPVDEDVVSAGTRARAITTAVDRYDVETVVLPNGGDGRTDSRVAKRVGCDVLTVSNEYQTPSISSILAPIAGGRHSGGVLDVANALAEVHGAWIELLYVRSASGLDDPEALMATARQRLEGVEVDTRIVENGPVADTISEQSDYYDVTVIGAPRKGRLRQFVFGSTARDVQGNARNAVVMVRRGAEPGRSLFSAPLH